MLDLDRIVSAVSTSKKYRSLCPDTVRHVALREIEAAPHERLKAAIKGTKRRLHQIYGAFEHTLDYDQAYEGLEAAYGTGSETEIRNACRHILERHSSTQERLPDLAQFYDSIFRITGRPNSILDLGCGLNPLTFPWMGLAAGTQYVALDIDRPRIEFLNCYLVLAGLEPLARCQDLLVEAPADDADLSLLLKMSPTLEHQERGSTQRLLDELRTPFVVLSYAVTSLAGREKGMLDHYQGQFLNLVAGRQWPIEKLTFDTELVFVIERGV
ncbi:hypothetical protein ACFLWA_01670 [Chloroflexota bacterium]